MHLQLENIMGHPNICVGSCDYELNALIDLGKKIWGEHFCSLVNGCYLPLPPKKYDFGGHMFRFPDKFHWILEYILKYHSFVRAKAKFLSAAGIELGCFEATVNYILK